MRTRTANDALTAAKSNAAYFDRPYIVFTDTNGNWRSEALQRLTQRCFKVVYPDGTVLASSVEREAGQLIDSTHEDTCMLKHPECGPLHCTCTAKS